MSNISKARTLAADMLQGEGRTGLANLVRQGQADDQDSVKAILMLIQGGMLK